MSILLEKKPLLLHDVLQPHRSVHEHPNENPQLSAVIARILMDVPPEREPWLLQQSI